MIRSAAIPDIHKISRLWFSMVKEMRPDWEPNATLWRKHCFRCLQGGNYFVFVEEVGGKFLGFIDYFLFPEPSTNKVHAIGQHFYMSPEFRGKGKVGWRLYRTAVADAINRGAQVLELFCFGEELPKWKRKGYEPIRFLVRKELGHV